MMDEKFFNVLSFRNGKTLTFQSLVPFSVDKLSEEWIIVQDAVNKQMLSFRSCEVVTIASCIVDGKTKKGKLQAKIVSE